MLVTRRLLFINFANQNVIKMKRIFLIVVLMMMCFSGFAQLQPRKNPITEKWGYVNKKDKWIISPQYDKAEPFEKKGKYATIMLDGKYGCINKKGELAIKPVFTDYEMMRHARQELELGNKLGSTIYPLKSDLGKYGFVNHIGEWTINPDYDQVGEFGANTFVAVCQNNKWGCVNRKGTVIVNVVFANRRIAEKAGMEIQEGNKKGRVLFPLQNDSDGLWGWANYAGEWVIKPAFDEVKGFNTPDDKIAYVRVKDKWGAVNRKDKFVIEPIFDLKAIANASMEYQNKAKKGATLYPIYDEYLSLWKFVDYVGKELIPPTYQDVKEIYNDKLILVKIQDKWGCVDKSFKVKIAPVFHEVEKAGAAMVELEKGTKKGKVLYPEYDDAMKAWGYVNIVGEWVISPLYEEANPFDGKEALVVLHGQKRLINKKGKLVDGLPEPIHQEPNKVEEPTAEEPAAPTEEVTSDVDIEEMNEGEADDEMIDEVEADDEAGAVETAAEEVVSEEGEEMEEDDEAEVEEDATDELPGVEDTLDVIQSDSTDIDYEIDELLKEFE